MGIIKAYLSRIIGPAGAREITCTELAGNKVGLDTTIAGGTISAVPSGLRTAVKITTMDITDAAADPLPAIPLVDRNSLSIHNKSATVTVYIGNINVTADTVDGTTSGWELAPNSFLNFDITDDVILYARTPTGQIAKVKILEMA